MLCIGDNQMIKESMRAECGRFLCELGSNDPNIVVLDADLKDSTQSVKFQEQFPERYFDIGIAEQNMVGIAAGLSLKGKIPIVQSFACFISMRACEQVRTTVAYPNLNVKFIVTHSGISCGSAGATHHAIEDLAIMRAIPNMTVFAPADVYELKQVLTEMMKHVGPAYVRLGASDTEALNCHREPFKIGKGTLLRKGNDATIFTTGTLAELGLKAANLLDQRGLDTRVIQMASLKPFDCDGVKKACRETQTIVTVEEHNIIGGLGSAVSEVIAEQPCGIVRRMGIKDRFCDAFSYDYLLEKEGLTAEKIVETVLSLNTKVQ
jgi:transketolase